MIIIQKETLESDSTDVLQRFQGAYIFLTSRIFLFSFSLSAFDTPLPPLHQFSVYRIRLPARYTRTRYCTSYGAGTLESTFTTAKFSQLFDKQHRMPLFYLFLLYNDPKSYREHIYRVDFILGGWFFL
ncbi:hypothetical protein L873DRAFT_549598 [Choiromyces venosus 120613-1]|uniref:Uncharacterized protein n=1 Tax=Choiromyces venosus 120613-1 TaxID=1336337 RepID=A0A3N4K5K3_9PEZI|nr:hypothetical protein L873DRAFT_549598 [Choiromyces venosus 120613-1]